MLPRWRQPTTDAGKEQVDLAVGPKRYQAPVLPHRRAGDDPAGLGARGDIERLYETRHGGVRGRVARAPRAALDAVQSNRAAVFESLTHEVQRRVTGRHVDPLDVMRAVRVPQVQ